MTTISAFQQPVDYWSLVYSRARYLDDAIALAGVLIGDEHDLIHKASGWVLREVGKKDQSVMEEFLLEHITRMPRTMLRSAIEQLLKEKREFYMRK